MRHSKHILTIQCLSTSNIRLYLFLAHCQAKALFMRACHANGCFSHTLAMTTHAMFAPYKSRVVSRGGLLLPLTYLPGPSVGKKITPTGHSMRHMSLRGLPVRKASYTSLAAHVTLRAIAKLNGLCRPLRQC